MTLFIIVGVLIPIIYMMQLNIKDKRLTGHRMLNTILLSVGGILITTIIGNLVTQQQQSLLGTAIGAIITGIIWALLLCGTYALLRLLRQAINKK